MMPELYAERGQTGPEDLGDSPVAIFGGNIAFIPLLQGKILLWNFVARILSVIPETDENGQRLTISDLASIDGIQWVPEERFFKVCTETLPEN